MSNRIVLNERSYHGKGARENVATEIKERGFKKIFVVTDKALIGAGVSDKVIDVLKNNNIEYTVFSEVKPNPTVSNVLEGLEMCKNYEADCIVAIGGGSVIDTAKAIGIIYNNP